MPIQHWVIKDLNLYPFFPYLVADVQDMNLMPKHVYFPFMREPEAVRLLQLREITMLMENQHLHSALEIVYGPVTPSNRALPTWHKAVHPRQTWLGAMQ